MTHYRHGVCFALALLCLATIPLGSLSAQEAVHTGRPLWQAYDTRSTGGAQVSHTAALTQEGQIIAANDAGLLTFDGLQWRRFLIGAERRSIQALARLPDGVWLVGGAQTFGAFEPDPTHGLIWNDLLKNSAEEAVPVFDTITHIESSNGNPIILTDRSVLEYSNGTLTERLSDAPTGFTFYADGFHYIATDSALLRLTGNGSTAVATPPSWNDITALAVIEFSTGRRVLVTERSGLFTLVLDDDAIRLTPLWDFLPLPLDTALVSSAIVLSDDSIILGTESGNLILLSKDGSTRFNLDKRAGFRAGRIRSIIPLPEGSVMAFYDGGAVWLNLQTSVRTWDAVNGLTAPVTSVATVEAVTYAGTEDGLFRSFSGHRMGPNVEAGPGPITLLKRFTRSGIRGHASLLIGKPDGLYDYYDGQVSIIDPVSPRAVHVSIDRPSRVAVATDRGITLLHFEDGDWQTLGMLETTDIAQVDDLTEAAEGTLVAAFSNGAIKTYGAETWLAEDQVRPAAPLSTQMSTNSGEPTVRQILVGQGERINLLASGPPQIWNPRTETFDSTIHAYEYFIDNATRWVSAAMTDDALWGQTRAGGVIVPTDKNVPSYRLPHFVAGTENHGLTAYDRANDRVFVGSANGLYAFSPDLSQFATNSTPDIRPSVARITVNDSIIYNGHGQTTDIRLPSENAVFTITLAALRWGFSCELASLVLRESASNRVLTTEPLTKACTAVAKGMWEPSGSTDYTFQIERDGKNIAKPFALRIAVEEPWVSKYWVPLILGVFIGAIAAHGNFIARRAWPEPVTRYMALLAGFLILWAVGVGSNLTTPRTTSQGVALQLLSLTGAALLMPLMVEGLMRVSDVVARLRSNRDR